MTYIVCNAVTYTRTYDVCTMVQNQNQNQKYLQVSCGSSLTVERESQAVRARDHSRSLDARFNQQRATT